MDKVDASNLLRTHLGASKAEVEAAYRKRRAEMRRRFEAARDRNTRTWCEREYFAIEQARNLLLDETEDLLKEREKPATEREPLPVELEGPPVELKGPPVEGKAPPVEREEPAVPREVLPVEREAPPVELKASPVQREESVVEHESAPIKRASPVMDGVLPPIEPVLLPIKRVFGPIGRASSPVRRVAGLIAGTASPMKRVAEPSEAGSASIEHVSPLKGAELAPLETALTQGRTRSAAKERLAFTGVMLILVSASALVFFLLRAPDKSKLGKLVVNTVPDSADVWLDGAPRGKTPLILENVTPGDRQLTIKLPGYIAEELVVPVRPGDEGFTRIVQLVPVEQLPFMTSSPNK